MSRFGTCIWWQEKRKLNLHLLKAELYFYITEYLHFNAFSIISMSCWDQCLDEILVNDCSYTSKYQNFFQGRKNWKGIVNHIYFIRIGKTFQNFYLHSHVQNYVPGYFSLKGRQRKWVASYFSLFGKNIPKYDTTEIYQ